MQFDSDSDSDGSHISSTPPRQPNPSPPTAATKTISSNSDSFPLLSLSSLPFHIRQRTSEAPSTSSPHSIETLPAGFFSKSISFSKIRKPLLNLEASENEPVVNSPKAVVKSAKKHPNLIGASTPTPVVKVLRGAGDGNFVKLNLNGKRKKFLSKGWNKKGKFGSGKRYRTGYSSYRSKRKKLDDEGEDNEEDGLGEENAKQQEKRKGWENECKVLEEAVLAARNEASDENLVRLLKLIHGYDSFREGQLEAIKNVLGGKSTMLILPTGAGKSLCYQLSALILPGITLVVSPLIALMIDQLRQLPPLISGALLSSSQTLEESSETLNQVRQGTIKVLFVSPERFLNEEFLSVISAVSAVSLVVIDEAHCISEWSHNFRPSFMRLRASLLHKSLNVGSVLAMTATATTTTLDAVMSALDIPYTNLIQNAHLRDNLRLSVSLIKNRQDLLVLIKSSPFTEVKSIIVYCKFQYLKCIILFAKKKILSSVFQSETDQISRYLNDNNIKAKSYHSGISAKERGYVQELFGSNKIRVVVATVAFGMGLDKRDVGAVIHYSLPESLEEYVQEIGRAGRDGRLSYCHLFYDDEMYFKLRSLMYSEGVDEYAVNKFMSEVFPADKSSCGKICSLIKESAARRFDMKEETPAVSLAQKVSAIAVILKRSENKHGQYIFDIPTVANDMGVTPVELTNQLYYLKLKGEITYEMKDMAYCYRILEVPTDFFSLSADITKWLSEVESCKVRKMDVMFNAAYFAVNLCDKMNGCSSANHTSCLQRIILDYFAGVDNIDFCKKISQSSPFLRADIKVFLQSNSHARFTPRAVARVMHGIASPAYPYTIWGKTHFWGRYTKIDFKVVMEAAKEELKNFIGKDMI
ncbi:hypothetical protein TSUD_67970 [Trifolium subterraneum]|uniref:DNA 3'-5' helicase n=1 Tax=Trifolium subterraneum TaxID=3900 RepID=A0A2Z6N2K9_TRISU|nr:hypothetical protein TSUD_67970 [Trifolium subterraneum]